MESLWFRYSHVHWRNVKDGSDSEGDDWGWVDYLRWPGSPPPDPNKWQTITYKYDPAGRRIEKKVDHRITRYCYDGDNLIAEYDSKGNLLRKYVYGPRVDEPVCMIDLADSNAVYYYHFDGLGSVVALTDADGTCVQTYEYSVYGHVAASDPNDPNPFMFTGRQFDIETGLYYYRARYYNPYLGRFLQTDPVGYGYAYCGNNPLTMVDPSGMAGYTYGFLDLAASAAGLLTFACFDSDKSLVWTTEFSGIDAWKQWFSSPRWFGSKKEQLSGWELSRHQEGVLWDIQALIYLGYEDGWESKIAAMEKAGMRVLRQKPTYVFGSRYLSKAQDGIGTVNWRPDQTVLYSGEMGWHHIPPLAALAHELGHAYDDLTNGLEYPLPSLEVRIDCEMEAMKHENTIRYAFYSKVPGYSWVLPRPAYGFSWIYPDVFPPLSSHLHPDIMWDEWLLNPELDP